MNAFWHSPEFPPTTQNVQLILKVTIVSGVYVSDTPFAPLGLALAGQRLLYTYRLSEALVNRISAPAVRKVYSMKSGLQIPPTKRNDLKLTPMR